MSTAVIKCRSAKEAHDLTLWLTHTLRILPHDDPQYVFAQPEPVGYPPTNYYTGIQFSRVGRAEHTAITTIQWLAQQLGHPTIWVDHHEIPNDQPTKTPPTWRDRFTHWLRPPVQIHNWLNQHSTRHPLPPTSTNLPILILDLSTNQSTNATHRTI